MNTVSASLFIYATNGLCEKAQQSLNPVSFNMQTLQSCTTILHFKTEKMFCRWIMLLVFYSNVSLPSEKLILCFLFFPFFSFQSKVWDAPERHGKEIGTAPRSLVQFTAGVSESSGPCCGKSLTKWWCCTHALTYRQRKFSRKDFSWYHFYDINLQHHASKFCLSLSFICSFITVTFLL